MPAYFPEGNLAAAGDNEQRSLQKINSSLNAAGTSVTGQYSGIGSPEGVVTAPVGSRYLDTSNLQAYDKYSGSGNTGWL